MAILTNMPRAEGGTVFRLKIIDRYSLWEGTYPATAARTADEC